MIRCECPPHRAIVAPPARARLELASDRRALAVPEDDERSYVIEPEELSPWLDLRVDRVSERLRDRLASALVWQPTWIRTLPSELRLVSDQFAATPAPRASRRRAFHFDWEEAGGRFQVAGLCCFRDALATALVDALAVHLEDHLAEPHYLALGRHVRGVAGSEPPPGDQWPERGRILARLKSELHPLGELLRTFERPRERRDPFVAAVCAVQQLDVEQVVNAVEIAGPLCETWSWLAHRTLVDALGGSEPSHFHQVAADPGTLVRAWGQPTLRWLHCVESEWGLEVRRIETAIGLPREDEPTVVEVRMHLDWDRLAEAGSVVHAGS